MDQSRKSGFSWGLLLSGIAFVIAGFYLMTHQAIGLRSIVIVFAIISIVQGVVWISHWANFHDIFGYSWVSLLGGILDIVIGLLFLFNVGIGASTIAILFAVWFIADSIVALVSAFRFKGQSTGGMVLVIILSIISLIFGIMLLMNPVVSALSLVFLVAFYLLVFGFNNIFASFIRL